MSVLEQFLESRDFYELSQAYRTASMADQERVIRCWDEMKAAILKWSQATEFVSEFERDYAADQLILANNRKKGVQ